MDALQDLIDEIKRLQLLVCAARMQGGTAEWTPTPELLDRLKLPPGDCRALVAELTGEGLLEAEPAPRHPLPRNVRLTPQGRLRLEEWQQAAR